MTPSPPRTKQQCPYIEGTFLDQTDLFGYVLIFHAIMATKNPTLFALGIELEYFHNGVN